MKKEIRLENRRLFHQGQHVQPSRLAALIAIALSLSSQFTTGQSSRAAGESPATTTTSATNSTANAASSAGNKSAWQTVTSKSNQFSALVPGEVRKAQQQSERHTSTTYFSSVSDGAHTTYYVIVCTKYGAEYAKKRTHERLMKESVHRQVTGYLGKLLKRTYHKVDGNDVLDYEFEGYAHSHLHAAAGKPRDLVARGRILWPGEIEYSLVYATTSRAAGGDCQRFFNSFKATSSQ